LNTPAIGSTPFRFLLTRQNQLNNILAIPNIAAGTGDLIELKQVINYFRNDMVRGSGISTKYKYKLECWTYFSQTTIIYVQAKKITIYY